MRRWQHITAMALYAMAVIAISTAVLSFSDPGLTHDTEAHCASRVISDWADDGQVAGRYQLRCYRAAIRSLPEDLRAYSTAPDDIDRAMRVMAASRPD